MTAERRTTALWFEPRSDTWTGEFLDRLAFRGVPVTVRDTRGTQIDGACGQLAATAS